MSRSLRAEWVKVTTTRAFLWIALADLALVVITSISVAVSSDEITTASDDRSVAQIAGVSVLFALVAGIVAMAGESTHGTITQTLLVTPVRERVFAAKAVTAAAIGVVLAVVSEAVVLFITVPGAGLSAHNARATLVGVLVAAPLAALLGVGLGAIVRGQGGGIAVALIWLLVGENLMPVISRDASRYVPGRAFAALASGSRQGTDVVLGMAGGAAAAAVWTAVFVAAGLFMLLGRDV
jgi:ABC-2 type transport system permease protein